MAERGSTSRQLSTATVNTSVTDGTSEHQCLRCCPESKVLELQILVQNGSTILPVCL
jgi:hypothetical protein